MSQTSIAILSDLIALVLVLGIGAVILARQPVLRLRNATSLVNLAIVCFIAGEIGTVVAATVPQKHAAISLLYTGTLWIPPTLWNLLRVVFEQHGARTVLSSRVGFRTVVAFAALMWLGAVTNPLHGQLLTPVVGGRNPHHWLWWLASGGSYLVLATSFLTCLWVALGTAGSDARLRSQAAILGLSAAIPLLPNLAYNLAFWPVAFDPSVPAFGLTALCVAGGVYGVGLLGISPVSLRAALASDPSAVLLVDRAGRLIFANEASSSLLGPAPLGDSVRAVQRVASQLRTPENHEPVPESELWALAGSDEKPSAGALYQRADGAHADDDPEWLWISAVPIASFWRTPVAYCFRIQDMTRLYEAERQRARLEARLWQSATQNARPGARVTDWRAEILWRLGSRSFFTGAQRPSPHDVERTLREIEQDRTLQRDLETMPPERVWQQFLRLLGRS